LPGDQQRQKWEKDDKEQHLNDDSRGDDFLLVHSSP